MGKVNRIARLKNRISLLFSEEEARLIFDGPKEIRTTLKSSSINFMFVQCFADSLQETARTVSRVIEASNFNYGIIREIFGNLIFITFDPLKNNPSDARRKQLADLLKKDFKQQVLVLHGQMDVLLGVYGHKTRLKHGPMIDLRRIFSTLSSMKPGDSKEFHADRLHVPIASKAEPIPTPMKPGESFFILIDTMGGGRIIGGFSSREKAEKFRAVNPSYYRVIGMVPEKIDPDCLGWLDKDQQTEMKALINLQAGDPPKKQ